MDEEHLRLMFFQIFDFDDDKNKDDLLLQLLINVYKLSKKEITHMKFIIILKLTCIYSAAVFSSCLVLA